MEKIKIIKEKENMKGQQAAFDKSLPGVQARCAVFLFNNTVKTLGSRQKKCLNWRVESLKVSKLSARVRTNRAVTTCW